MRRFQAMICLVVLATLSTGIEIGADEVVDSIDSLWKGFDPRALPLEVEVFREWDEEDIHLQSLYFTGEEFEGEKTRIFGFLGRPKMAGRDKLPAVLHIHGGGQTANLGWPRLWAKRGYVCLSFDFCGNTNQPNLGPEYRREQYTKWGKVPADMTAYRPHCIRGWDRLPNFA